MSNIVDLLEVRTRNYDEWRKLLDQKKKKLQFKTNNSNQKIQSEAKDGLRVISCVDQLMDNIDKDDKCLTLGIKVICVLYENGTLSNSLPILINAFKKDEDCIRAISSSNLPKEIKKEWDKKVGKGIVDNREILEKIGRIAEIICGIIPMLFLITLTISGHTTEYWETPGGISPMAFFAPLAVFLVIKFISVRISKKFYISNHTLGKRIGLITGIVSLICSFIPPVYQGLHNLSADCIIFYLVYLYLATSVQVTNEINGPLILFSDIKRMIREREI